MEGQSGQEPSETQEKLKSLKVTLRTHNLLVRISKDMSMPMISQVERMAQFIFRRTPDARRIILNAGANFRKKDAEMLISELEQEFGIEPGREHPGVVGPSSDE